MFHPVVQSPKLWIIPSAVFIPLLLHPFFSFPHAVSFLYFLLVYYYWRNNKQRGRDSHSHQCRKQQSKRLRQSKKDQIFHFCFQLLRIGTSLKNLEATMSVTFLTISSSSSPENQRCLFFFFSLDRLHNFNWICNSIYFRVQWSIVISVNVSSFSILNWVRTVLH